MVTHQYAVGLDLGPPGTFTALATVDRIDDRREAEPAFAVRHLQRFPPGTPYVLIAAKVNELLAAEELAWAHLVVDITAVGAGVLELFDQLRQDVVPVVVTAGHAAEWGANHAWNVPKKVLVTGLQMLLQGRLLAIPKSLPDAELLARELGNFRAKVSLATDPMQAEWREGQDDDLVLAVALAGWEAARMDAGPVLPPMAVAMRHNPMHGPLYEPGMRRWCQ